MSANDANGKLAVILREFAEMVGGNPTLKEFLQFLQWSANGIYPMPLTFEVLLADGSVYSGPEESRVPELSDSMFTGMADLLAGMSGRGGGPVAPNDLASILLDFIDSKASNLQDVSSGDISLLSISVKEGADSPSVGDIIAVPVGDFWYAVIMVARNRFGIAFGIFREKFDSLASVKPQGSAACKFPVYSDDLQVLGGSWEVVGHDETLLSAFPVEPEIYHSPVPNWPGFDFGKFGAAETPAGDIRLIDSGEAKAVGVIDGSYRQAFSSNFLQQSLEGLARRY